MTPQPADLPPKLLAEKARAWRGSVSVAKAAPQLGIPKRTWEAMEQGRGFPYPQLLLIAFKSTPCVTPEK